ncbi:MAG: flagellar protein FlaG [Lachnospira sp.]|nr:flagellar protein FlaG [Lachnospira sp.]
MGIEAIGSVVTGPSYQSVAATKPVVEQQTVQAVEATATAQSDALNQAVAIGQVMSSEESNKDGAEGGKPKKKEEATMKDVAELNKLINRKTIAEFGYNEPTNRITIKIKDKETDEVIKEIPSDKALEMLAKAWELAGILVDEKR